MSFYIHTDPTAAGTGEMVAGAELPEVVAAVDKQQRCHSVLVQTADVNGSQWPVSDLTHGIIILYRVAGHFVEWI